ncbi:hypothetical protein H8356DRAFT_1313697 [Neocallimastix lanati (nom. inval.)]|nr:hypothetical protein H8356DRAFT_1313697 [Neocallimastix sp. JGI-2020a]
MLNNYFEINRTSTEVFELNSKNKRSINIIYPINDNLSQSNVLAYSMKMMKSNVVYGHCSRLIGDPCTNKNECSNGKCNGVCYIPDPSEEGESLDFTFQCFGFIIIDTSCFIFNHLCFLLYI